MSENFEYVVRCEPCESPGDLAKKLGDIESLASDLQSGNPSEGDAEALMHLAADVLCTLRRNALNTAAMNRTTDQK